MTTRQRMDSRRRPAAGVAAMSGGVQRDSPTAPTAVWSPAKVRTGTGEPRDVFEQTEYELFEEIGRGGMGRVYRAQHRKLKRPVAVKLLTDRRLDDVQAISRFLREMEIVGQLDHPHLVRAHDAGEIAGVHYLAMELVDGLDLHQLVRLVGALSVADACELVRQAALGLQYAYQRGLVHQDVKPSNLLLSRNGVVKVADLGLARLDTWRESTELITTSDRIVGTFDFMAPEQAQGSQHVDIGADIYGLGCTLFFLLAGRAPFAHPSHDTPAKKLMAHAAEPPPALSEVRTDVPQEVSQIVERTLAKRPQDRYAQPADVAAALAPFSEASNVSQLAATAISERSKTGDGQAQEPDPFAKTASFRKPLPTTDPATTRKAILPQTKRRRAWVVGAIAALVAIGVGIYASQLGGKKMTQAEAEWARELGQSPSDRPYPGVKGDGRWHISDRSRALELSSDSPRLIELGNLDGRPCRIEIDIQQPAWGGDPGVFLGYREQAETGERIAVFQLIQLSKDLGRKKDEEFEIERLSRYILPRSPDSTMSLGTKWGQVVPWPTDGQPMRLAIDIGPHGLRRLTWSGRVLDKLCLDKVNKQFKLHDYEGPWGLYLHHGTVWFSRPKIERIE